MLTELQFRHTIDTSSSDLINDFFVPALCRSKYYDRGVGYFSSGWIKQASLGMVQFANNGGKARWVASPILDTQDWEALKIGEEAKTNPILFSILRRNIISLQQSLEQDILSALAWMVADEIITFKLALPYNKLEWGNFHDKFGIFTDSDNNQVSFNGSYNDSIQGSRNYESIKIFTSWSLPLAPFVIADKGRFDKIWDNMDPNVKVFDLPEAAKYQILQLRSGDRPYPEPHWINRISDGSNSNYKPIKPYVPTSLVLRDYQNDAIEAWFRNDCQGFLEMATGTGKTITSLAASEKLYREKGDRLAVVISVPYQHLVDQWSKDAQKFGFQPILAYQSRESWYDDFSRQVIEFNGGYRNFISIITTHTTFSSEAFLEVVTRIKSPCLLIADEAHHLGSERNRQNYPMNIPYRLALSATPDRWFDDIGTSILRSYFGDTVFSFSLEQAIGISLTPYYYYPHLVPLTDEEMVLYQELTRKIARLVNRNDFKSVEVMKILLMKRAELLNKAQNKLISLSELIDVQTELDHALFYCAPGQIDEVLGLLGWDKGLLVHQFTAEEDVNERRELLENFAKGNYQALVAMKCLDEGVDVPSTKTAYFLASSSNPREFIQRRGRILRKFPGKEFSTIHDLIAVPPEIWSASDDNSVFNVERGIIRKELQRFKEFANPALNKHQAIDVIWDLAKRYGLLDF
ncbi:MAG: DEAD/DEAH box helicase family protein [Anaerolineaceae bacterium]|nr:DEAD/DEAH box helicase family protein [Anaerolineaceae bacterium]